MILASAETKSQVLIILKNRIGPSAMGCFGRDQRPEKAHFGYNVKNEYCDKTPSFLYQSINNISSSCQCPIAELGKHIHFEPDNPRSHYLKFSNYVTCWFLAFILRITHSLQGIMKAQLGTVFPCNGTIKLSKGVSPGLS